MFFYPQKLLVAWMVLSALGFWLFHRSRDAVFKRRWWPWFVLASEGVFLVIISRLMPPGQSILIMVPSAVLAIYANLCGVRFCNACGRTIVLRQAGSGKAEFCPYCGTRLVD